LTIFPQISDDVTYVLKGISRIATSRIVVSSTVLKPASCPERRLIAEIDKVIATQDNTIPPCRSAIRNEAIVLARKSNTNSRENCNSDLIKKSCRRPTATAEKSADRTTGIFGGLKCLGARRRGAYLSENNWVFESASVGERCRQYRGRWESHFRKCAMVAGSGRVIHRRTLNGRRLRGVHTSTAMSHRSPSTWSRKNGGEHDMGFERRLASSNPHCGQSRSQSRSPTPREMVHAAGPIRRSVGLSRLALVPPYVRSVDSTNRRMLSASRNINELLQSASSPEPLQVEYFDQPQQDSRTRIDDLSDCDVVEVGRHILGQSYATVEDIRVSRKAQGSRGKLESIIFPIGFFIGSNAEMFTKSFVNELPIEGAHIDMASLLDAIQNMDTLNAADLVFPLVGMAALLKIGYVDEEIEMIPPELYSSFSVRTRERGLKGVTYIDFPQVYLKAIAGNLSCI
uniref:Uncharacterized protein n=1 Tax=Parascaris equorum TaxID=6256 RepID=A0A914RM56_PAREQ